MDIKIKIIKLELIMHNDQYILMCSDSFYERGEVDQRCHWIFIHELNKYGWRTGVQFDTLQECIDGHLKFVEEIDKERDERIGVYGYHYKAVLA